MPTFEYDKTTENGFTRRSATESTCVFCLLTIRSRTTGFLELAESVHCQFCSARPRSSATQPQGS